MRVKAGVLVLFILSVALGAVVVGDAAESNRTVTFKDRTIDLKPYIEGFPYNGFRPFYEADKMYYYYTGETTELKEVSLSGDVDLRDGRTVCDIDFSKRNVWGIRYNKNDKHLYWSGDEVNDEVINLYRLHPDSGDLTKLTDVPYIFGWRWNEGQHQVAYVARLGDKDNRLGELRILDLASGEERVVAEDKPEMRFTWTTPSWRPNARGVVVTALKDADRTFGNLVYVDLTTGEWKPLLDDTKPRYFPSAFKKWLNNNEFLYTSNEDGFRNIYKYNVEKMTSTTLTTFDRDLTNGDVVKVNGKSRLVAVLSNPIENDLLLLDPSTGKVLAEQSVDVNLGILDTDDDRMLVSSTSAVQKFQIDEVVASKKGFSFHKKIGLPADLEDKILHARVERLEFPTFDKDPATGEARKLHAFLYHPENPLPKDQQIVMIQSFYGGGNYYSTRTQILAEAGIYVLSPSPRGSSGFGREFSALNDKDLGGNEIVDVIYAARYVSERLGIPAERVGVYGGSHGGYATMRLLTFPGQINDVTADFDWGFGISHAGFSDIVHFYEHCNIPDWVTLEAGDPKTESEKLRDRSPLYHADKCVGKLLLTHGTNDSRVPIEGSRMMADSLRKYHKDVTLVEFEGQGHGIKGLENNVRNYNVWFNFLESLARPTS